MKKDVALITTIYTTPLFIEYQYKLLNKFLKQTFDLYVVDDCDDKNESNEVKNICEKYNLIYKKCPSHPIDKRNGGDRHMNGLNSGLKIITENYEFVGILDGDMFLIDILDMNKIFDNYDIVSHMSGSGGVTYFWPG